MQTSRTNFATEQKVGFMKLKVTRATTTFVGRYFDIIFCYVQNRMVINNFSKLKPKTTERSGFEKQ